MTLSSVEKHTHSHQAHPFQSTKKGTFYVSLNEAVNTYFVTSGKRRRGTIDIYTKTTIILLWFSVSWVGLFIFARNVEEVLIWAISLGFSIVGIGFSIQHDANHGAYSGSRKINIIMGYMLDFVGASSFIWRQKHNYFHHCFTNCEKLDDDLEAGILVRLAPWQKWYRWHRWQHLYIWILYGLLKIRWDFFDDFFSIFSGKIGFQRLRHCTTYEFCGFAFGKIVYFTWALIIPLCLLRPALVLLYYVSCSIVVGLSTSVVFQLAHCTNVSAFLCGERPQKQNVYHWAAAQMMTTANFSPTNRFLTWYLGGLNFQIEHHLFPHICHTHYPYLSIIVRHVAANHGFKYHQHKTIFHALRAHYDWLRKMGHPNLDARNDL